MRGKSQNMSAASAIGRRSSKCVFGAGFRLRGIRMVSPLLLAAVLAACTGPLSTAAQRHNQQETKIPVVAPAPAQERLVAIDPYKTAPSIAAEGQEQETAAIKSKPTRRAAERQQGTPRRSARAIFDPNRLLGLRRDDVVALLGTPSLLRRDPPAELWLYEGRACTAHVFLYQTSPGSAYEVRHVEAQVSEQPAAANAGACLASLVTAGDGGRFGLLR